MRRPLVLALGGLASMAVTAVWHGPLGAGDRLASRIETAANAQLQHDEMTQVQARLERDPLSRRLILTGPADAFQRSELVARMEALPGIGEARWNSSPKPAEQRR